MTLEHVLAIVAFSVAAAGTPGPSNALLIATGANVGVVRGLPALLGVATSMGLLTFLVAYGLGAVILQNLVVMTAVKWAGAATLCWLAWRIACSHRTSLGGDSRPVGFIGAASFQWINPKSWLVSASAAATFLSSGRGTPELQATMLALIFVAAALPSCFVWLAFGAAAQRVLRSERALRTFNIGMGVLLGASALLFLT